MDQLFAAAFSVDGAVALLVSVCIRFIHGYGSRTTLSRHLSITRKEGRNVGRG